MKINELAKLYDITAHTLRYYEKLGLITPDYDENGYRNFHSLHRASPFYESYLIDFHETNKPEEYVTRLEILVES